MDMKELESERDFYFEKLRGIEVMLQVYKEKVEEEEEELGGEGGGSSGGVGGEEMKKVIDKIFKVMYAGQDDNVVVDDEGNVSFCVSSLCICDWFVCCLPFSLLCKCAHLLSFSLSLSL